MLQIVCQYEVILNRSIVAHIRLLTPGSAFVDSLSSYFVKVK